MNPNNNIFAVIVAGILAILVSLAAVFATGGLVVLAFRFLAEQLKGGF